MLVLFVAMSTGFAQENIQTTSNNSVNVTLESNVSAVDESELKILNDPMGAKIRVLQLQKRVEFQIEIAKLIKEQISTEEGVNKEKLDEVIVNLESLNENLKTIDYSQDSNALAQEYVNYKSDAIEFTNQFRNEVSAKMSAEKKEFFQGVILQRREISRNNPSPMVKQMVDDYNAQRTQAMLNRFNIVDEEMVNQVRAGQMNAIQAKEQLRNRFMEMNATAKREMVQEMKQEREQLRQNAPNVSSQRAGQQGMNTGSSPAGTGSTQGTNGGSRR